MEGWLIGRFLMGVARVGEIRFNQVGRVVDIYRIVVRGIYVVAHASSHVIGGRCPREADGRLFPSCLCVRGT